MSSRNEPARVLILMGFISAATCLGLAVLFVLIDLLAARPIWDDWALDLRGVATTAEPISAKTGEHASSDAGTQSTVYIKLRFKDSQGKEHTGEVMTVERNVILAATQKQPLKIEYDPENPNLVRLAGASVTIFGNVPVFLALGGFLGIVLFFWGALLGRRQKANPPPPPPIVQANL